MIIGEEYRSTSPSNFKEYLAAVWQRRFFWTTLVRLDLQARYRRSVLGLGWSLANPIGMTCVLCVVFHNLFGMEIRSYAPFVLTGMACWNYFTSAVLEGCQCFQRSESYIRAIPAPLVIYTLRTTVGGLTHFLIVLGVSIVVTGLFRGFSAFFPLLSLVPSLLFFLVFAWALATIFAFSNVMFPDMQHLATIGMQLLFYLTPVFYPEEMLRHAAYNRLFQMNPFTHFLSLVRAPLLYGEFPSLTNYAIVAATTALASGLALWILRKQERTLIFYM